MLEQFEKKDITAELVKKKKIGKNGTFVNTQKLKSVFKHAFSRVVTHSGKLREFSSCRKSQGNSGNFQIIENLRKTQWDSGKF